jgi:hypothetical protein
MAKSIAGHYPNLLKQDHYSPRQWLKAASIWSQVWGDRINKYDANFSEWGHSLNVPYSCPDPPPIVCKNIFIGNIQSPSIRSMSHHINTA